MKKFIAFLLCLTLCLAVVGIVGIAFVNNRFPLRYVDIVNENAEMFDLDPAFVFAVIHAESRFNSRAVSRVGASGLMQIMESTAYWIAPRVGLDDFDYEVHIFDPEINIRLGVYYLHNLANAFGDLEVALAAYNAGRGNVHRWLNDPEFSSDGVTLDYIPFSETRNYLIRVADNERIYTFLLRFPGVFAR